MEQTARRKEQTSKLKVKAKSGIGTRSSSSADIRTTLRRVWSWLKQSPLFPWLRDTALTLWQSIMGNRSWPVVLVQIGLWVLLLWLLSNLHMGVPCFLLVLVYWLYNTITEGRGPAPDKLHQMVVGEAQENNLCPTS